MKLKNSLVKTHQLIYLFSFLFLLIMCSISANAQLYKAKIGINGLTCSQCCRSVYIKLDKLPFVQRVDISLEETYATVYFKKKNIHINQLANAVVNGGFSTRYITLFYKNENGDTLQSIKHLRNKIHLDKLTQDTDIQFKLIGKLYNSDKSMHQIPTTFTKKKNGDYFGLLLK